MTRRGRPPIDPEATPAQRKAREREASRVRMQQRRREMLNIRSLDELGQLGTTAQFELLRSAHHHQLRGLVIACITVLFEPLLRDQPETVTLGFVQSIRLSNSSVQHRELELAMRRDLSILGEIRFVEGRLEAKTASHSTPKTRRRYPEAVRYRAVMMAADGADYGAIQQMIRDACGDAPDRSNLPRQVRGWKAAFKRQAILKDMQRHSGLFDD